MLQSLCDENLDNREKTAAKFIGSIVAASRKYSTASKLKSAQLNNDQRGDFYRILAEEWAKMKPTPQKLKVAFKLSSSTAKENLFGSSLSAQEEGEDVLGSKKRADPLVLSSEKVNHMEESQQTENFLEFESYQDDHLLIIFDEVVSWKGIDTDHNSFTSIIRTISRFKISKFI
jgi:hypothetical protein